LRTKSKPSISSRTSVRGLIIACLPAAALGVVADSPVLGAAFNQPADQGFTVDNNPGARTNIPSTNSTYTPTDFHRRNVGGTRG
jgi:hypothetical protein